MRTVAIVQARMASTRLPGKVLAEAAGKPLLQHMIERLERCEMLDGICIAIADEIMELQGSDPIADYMIGRMIDRDGKGPIHWIHGPVDDVLARVLKAAHKTEADVIVELTADCPLIDPEIVDQAVRRFQTGQHESLQGKSSSSLAFVSTSRPSLNPRNLRHAYPSGMDVRVFSTKTLEKVDRLTQDSADREHVSLYIWEHQRQFWCHDLLAPEELQDDVRLTVDTSEDLALVRAVFEHFKPREDMSLAEILAFLNAQPVIKRLNANVQQKVAR